MWDAARVHVTPRRRRVGFLFQDHALFPHLDVDANVAYGLHQLARRDRAARVHEALEIAGASHLTGRATRELSGGEAQRVALARALAPRPRLLLLDEPLSALDSPTRTRLRVDLRQRLLAAGVPTLVVTHDRTEALTLGDRMVVIIDGRLHQVGPVPDVFSRPSDLAVADAVEAETVVAGTVPAFSTAWRSCGSGMSTCLPWREPTSPLAPACLRLHPGRGSRPATAPRPNAGQPTQPPPRHHPHHHPRRPAAASRPRRRVPPGPGSRPTPKATSGWPSGRR